MKRILTVLLILLAVRGFAQNYPVTGINITLPGNPDPNTANWGTGTSIFMITASTQAVNGRVSPNVIESKILVTIKKGGGKACGDYTSNSTPASGFNTLTKVWGGTNATSLLGKGCILAPGDYEICVQFFGYGTTGAAPLSDVKCKPFSIKAKEQQTYQPPQPLSPSDGAKFGISSLQKPLIFKWLPIIPKSQEPVMYRLKVWQLMEKQNVDQAMKVNQPLINKDVDNSTQTIVTNLVSDPCRPPYSCDFVWNVQALNREGKPVGENNGTSKPSLFSATSCDVNLALKLISVECLSTGNGNNDYKICLSSTYNSPNYNLTYSSGIGFKAYPPSFSPFYAVTNITPALQVQSSGVASTVNYCINVSVPVGQTSLKIGLQGDDSDPGPMTCQPGAELDLRLPACATTCDCGNWVLLTVQNLTGLKKYECNSTIPWNCKVPFNFTDTYQCNPNNGSCQAKITWDVKASDGQVIKSGTGTGTLSDGFSLTSNGVYTLTLNATCNGIVCNSCVYKIVVSDCPPTCDCGTWAPILINKIEYKCGGKMEWKCNQTINFSDTYQCSPNDASCQAKTKWEITLDGLPYQSQGGASGSFTPTTNGVYTITMYASCNDKECPPCTYTFIVKDCKCDCGSWGLLTVQNAAGPKRYDCGSTIAWSCKVPFNFTDTYQCNPNNESCQAKTTWEVKNSDGTVIKSGTGTGTLSDGFSLTSNGIYTLTLNATCNGIVCKPCVYSVIVRDCPTCDCGKWIDGVVRIETGGAVISRVKCDGTATLGKGTYSFVFPGFVCSPDNNTCVVSYLWSVQGPVSGNGTGQTFSFNFSQAGTYTVTVTPLCGGKKCPPCKIIIKIEDPLPCSLSFTGKLQDKYCVGDQVTINWSGTTPPATVNLVLIDFTNWTVFQTIASGIPNSGSYTWTLPAGLPCDPERKWCFYVTDPASTPQCWNYSSEFIIGCCHTPTCDCGAWGPMLINKIKYDCGGKMEWKCNQAINFSDTYQCSPNDATCQAKTKWEITLDGLPYQSQGGASGLFTPTANGVYTITMYASCNGKECPPCTYTFIVKDCKCDCGSWGLLTVQNAAGPKRYDCGSTIAWSCKVPFNFTDTYQCNPNNESCQAKTTWEVKNSDGTVIKSGTGTGTLSDGFSLTSNGIYTLMLNATCNGIVCKPCVYKIVVKDCAPTCDCGAWGPMLINKIKYDCGGKMEWKCNQTINFSDTYQCSPNDATCQAKTKWEITLDGLPYQSQGGASGLFTPTANGVYTITMYASCNGKECPPCTYTFIVKDCKCDCGSWGLLTVQNAAGPKRYDCGSTIAWSCKVPFNFTDTYQCNPNNESCQAKTTWEVKNSDGTVIKSGTGTGTLSDGFSLTSNGIYTLMLNATCNGIVCKPCVYKIVVKDCAPTCDCGAWGPMLINKIKYDCGGKMEWKCNQAINFSDTYQCSPNDATCQAKTKWEIKMDDGSTQTGSGTNGSYTPTANGTYIITLNATCNGIECKPCTFTLVVKDCPKCDCGKWTDPEVKIEKDGAIISRLKCEGPETALPKGTYKILFPDYLCDPNNTTCSVSYSWSVQGPVTGYGIGQIVTFNFIQAGTYLVTITPTCGEKQCPPCKILIKIDDPLCDCGSWGALNVHNTTGSLKYECGSKMLIPWRCNQPFSFASSFQCNPNTEKCKAIVAWEVKMADGSTQTGSGTSGSFIPTTNGLYSLILTATCNGIKCKPCVYTISVRDCPECDCGKWINSSVNIRTEGKTISRVKCGETAVISKGNYSFIFPGFDCFPDNNTCSASYLWSVQGPVSGNGTGQTVSFNFSQAGTYTLTVTPLCGGKKCPPCRIVIKIEDPLPCSLSFSGKLKDKYCSGEPVTINWTGTSSPTTVNLVLVDFTNWTVYQTIASGIPNSGSYSWTLPVSLPCNPERKWCFYITDPASAPQCWNYSQEFTIGCCPVSSCNCGTWSPLASNGATYDCGSRINWNCKQPFSFTASYQCTPNDESCQAKATWVIEKEGRPIKSGSGTNRLRDEFSLTENGSYTLILNASCNGIECKPCTYTIDVKDCNDKPCTCKENQREINQKITYKDGNSGHSQTVSCSGVLDTKVLAGSVIEYEIPSYGCGPGLCNVIYEWQIISVIKDEVISSGLATSLTNFTAPGVVGDYQVVITAVCGTKPCGSCGFYFSTFKCIHIGDNYGGGVVFYVDNTCYHGLVAAPADQGTELPAISVNGTVSGGGPLTSLLPGTGNSNTFSMRNLNSVMYFGSYAWIWGENENKNNASQYCFDLVLNGYDDWFLPSKNELNLLYLQRNLVGGFGNGEYWSSSLYWLTESDNPYRFAWFQKFDNGNQGYVDFHLIKKVRAIRGF